MNNCLCVSSFKAHSNIVKEISQIVNYEFIYDNDTIFETFINNNPIDGFSLEDFKKITDSAVKKIVFIFYYLYVKGGFYIDLRVIPTANLKNVDLKGFSLLCVKSIMNENNLFLGILGCKKNEPVVLELIKAFVSDPTDISNKILNCPNVLRLNEKKIYDSCVSTVDANGTVLFNHYFNDTHFYKFPLLKNEFDVKKCIRTDKSKIKIGITILVFEHVKQFFSNGINQNSLYLCELFLNMGFDTYFIINDKDLIGLSETILKTQLYDERFKYVKYSEILNANLNVFITLSFSDSNTYVHNYLKYTKTKLVGYFCGNSYIIDTEKLIY